MEGPVQLLAGAALPPLTMCAHTQALREASDRLGKQITAGLQLRYSTLCNREA